MERVPLALGHVLWIAAAGTFIVEALKDRDPSSELLALLRSLVLAVLALVMFLAANWMEDDDVPRDSKEG